MNSILRNTLAASTMAIATQAAAQAIFYEHPNFQGRSFTTQQSIGNLERYGFNNRASSAVVRGETWQVCDGAGFSGQCAVLRPGEYKSLGAMGLNDSVSSVRAASTDVRQDRRYAPYDTRNPLSNEHRYVPDDYRYAPAPAVAATHPASEYRYVPGDYRYAANPAPVTYPASQYRYVPGDYRYAPTPAAAAYPAYPDYRQRGAERLYQANVTSVQAQPNHWDVTYSFRGQEHRVQMTSPPGSTLTVNEQGEPRA